MSLKQTPTKSAFITGFPANTLLVGTGEHTNGLVLAVKQAHSPGIPTLHGQFRIVANHGVAHSLLAEHLPSHEISNSVNTFEALRTSILDEVGVIGNADIINTNLLHPDNWTAHFLPSEDGGWWDKGVNLASGIYNNIVGQKKEPQSLDEMIRENKLKNDRLVQLLYDVLDKCKQQMSIGIDNSNIDEFNHIGDTADVIQEKYRVKFPVLQTLWKLTFDPIISVQFRRKKNSSIIFLFMESDEFKKFQKKFPKKLEELLLTDPNNTKNRKINDTYDAMLYMEVAFLNICDVTYMKNMSDVTESKQQTNINSVLQMLKDDITPLSKFLTDDKIYKSKQLKNIAEHLSAAWTQLHHMHLWPMYFTVDENDVTESIKLVTADEFTRIETIHKMYENLYDKLKEHGYEYKNEEGYSMDPRTM